MKKDDFTAYVKSIYPNMIEDYWLQYGELHFYRSRPWPGNAREKYKFG